MGDLIIIYPKPYSVYLRGIINPMHVLGPAWAGLLIWDLARCKTCLQPKLPAVYLLVGLYRGYTGIMDKKMESTTLYWGLRLNSCQQALSTVRMLSWVILNIALGPKKIALNPTP